VGYFLILKKLSNVNYHPIGENSPNLVTLQHVDNAAKAKLGNGTHHEMVKAD
jgi:hypothetical protein